MTLPSTRPTRRTALIVIMAACAACGGGEPSPDVQGTSVSGFSLPADGEIPGWSLATQPEHYVADNLWDYINGQADFFIDYGFEQVDAAEYRNDQESSSVVLEVWQMGRPQEAFGIFAAERTTDDRPLGIGSGAYLGANVLGFWQSKLYVKLISFEEGPEIEQLLIGLAEEVSSRVPGQKDELETLLLFPEEGRVEASERFIPKNFLGQPYLTDAYRADYTVDGEDVQLFIVEAGSPEEAQFHFNRLEEFYREGDHNQVTMDTANDPAMLCVEGSSNLVVFHLEHRLGGVIGMQTSNVGRVAAAELAETMRR
jgi:hypothetical protein